MPRVRTAPFLRARDGRVSVVGWYHRDAAEMRRLPDALDDWDPAVPFRARVAITLDAAGVAEDCQLDATGSVRASLLWRSRGGSELRGTGTRIDLPCTDGIQTLELDVDIPGDRLAGNVELTVAVTSTSNTRPLGPLAPDRPGAVLWRTGHSVRIEGSASRFPMEWADFTDSPSLPDGAAWYLAWDPSDLRDSLAGSVRLYLNRAHPFLSRMAEDTAPPDLERAVWEMLFFDVGRALLTGALRQSEFVVEPDACPEDSVGGTVRRLLNLHFPLDRPSSLAELLGRDPGRFEALLQERLRLMTRFG